MRSGGCVCRSISWCMSGSIGESMGRSVCGSESGRVGSC